MIGLVKENTSNISNNIIADGIYTNENFKSHSINSQSQKDERKRASKKNKAVGDSAFRAFANNFMSLFGYGDTLKSVNEAGFSEITAEQKPDNSRQSFSDVMGVEHTRNETVAIGTDVEDGNSPTKESKVGGLRLEVGNSVASLNADNKLSHSSKVTEKNSEAVSKPFPEKKTGHSQLQIIAHVSGRPVHAKYSYGKNKFKVAHKNAENPNGKHFGSDKEGKQISDTQNFNSIIIPSPVIQFRQVPVQVVGQRHQIVYNTPLISQRIIPQTNKIIYQPVYTHNQVEMASNGPAGPIGHGVMHKNMYSHETFVGANTVFSGKELPGSYSAGMGATNALKNTNVCLNNQILGFGTPLVGCRSMSHVPNNGFISMDSDQTSGGELLDVNQETRLQSSNEIATSSVDHPRNGTGGSLASVGSSCQPTSSFRLGIPIKVKTLDENSTKKKENQPSAKNGIQSSKQVVRTSNGNFQTLSLTTTTSSDTGSVTMSNGSLNPKTTLEKNANTNIDVVKPGNRENSKILEKINENENGTQKGFIPQASPVVNYRSALDYLVTPMVRYRDIASNLKVRTVPPQLSSNDACKFFKTEVSGNGIAGLSNSSNSPRNMNFTGSNEYRETVYTPVAPFPIASNYPVVTGPGNSGVIEMVNSKIQPNGNVLVTSGSYIDNSILKQIPTLNTHGSNPINGVVFPGNSQGGRIFDRSLNSHICRAPVAVPQNLGYRLVRTAAKNHVGAGKIPVGGGVSIYKENYTKEENFSYNKNHNVRKGYVNKMYQYLADSSQFPPLPKEIYVDDIEFLTRPISSESIANMNKKLSINTRDSETNVSLVKCSTPGVGREWDSINRGTFCTVYKVRHGECIAAIKCPQKRIHDLDPLMSRYRCYTEWKLLYRCNRHPNILNLIGGIRINEYEIWLVTEYIKTGDLFKLIHGNGSRSKTFRESVEYRYKVMYQLSDSIRFLHSLSPKIVHKDLKSNNILIDENYNIRVCDFGDAEELHYNVITCCTAVTWQYAPPEIVGCSDPAKPNSNANEKVDVWSMGCIFLEILCKRTPLQHILDKVEESGKHSTLYNLIHSNKIEGELKIPPLPDSLYNLITMCLRPNPELRASSKEVFDYLVNNEKKILKQLSYINQYKLTSSGGHSITNNQNNDINALSQFRAV
ncbi:protein kinase domain-containing protein [Cryptosporidium ubiquitum]|uniref:Protein kinase domain-containing protein n=1 Tax=Cryptosporidium ubiquitum TaxID=857276 RepID=A0A1J4ML21_9CRYT|nr:protein kinase domain-containing protein [Cryptosporidium ubiquitum]OII74727.1 protein kinase domain-containing protein [Cryptosporidium ubiquitum]